MSKSVIQKEGYITALDGIRAIAVMAVVAYHLDITQVAGGFLGVDMFFVLSGYLITEILLSYWKSDKQFSLTNFWARRFRRLLPALIFMLVVLVCYITLFEPRLLSSIKDDVLITFVYGNNWWLIFHQVSYFEKFSDPAPLVHLWSLSVEGQFYIVWPFLFALALGIFRKRGYVLLFTLALITASVLTMVLLYHPGEDPSRVYYGTDTRIFALLIGSFLALLTKRSPAHHKKSVMYRIWVELIGWFALGWMIYQLCTGNEFDDGMYPWGLLLAAIVTAVLVGSVIQKKSILGRILSWKPLRWIGLRSYGIYIWHYPIIELTRPSINTDGFNVWLTIGQVAASVVLAAFSYHFVEVPIRRNAHGGFFKGLHPRYWNFTAKNTMLTIGGAALIITFAIGMFMKAPELVTAEQKTIEAATSADTETTTPAAEQDAGTKTEATPETKTDAKTDTKPEANSDAKPDTSSDAKTDQPADKPAVANADKDGKAAANPSASTTADHPDSKASSDNASPEVQTYGKQVTAVGDSVILDIKPYIEKVLPGIHVDGQVGRQMFKGEEIITSLHDQGKLRSTIVIALGSNGVLNRKNFEEFLQTLKDIPNVVLVNTRVPRKWEATVNQTLQDAAGKYSNITLVDWYATSAHHDNYFVSDGVHLTAAGSKAYTKMLVEALNKLHP